jgi:hypothetical protein
MCRLAELPALGGADDLLGHASGAGAHQVDGEDHQRDPDEAEPDPPLGGHHLTVDDDAEQELQGGRQVLQRAQSRERDAPGRRAE